MVLHHGVVGWSAVCDCVVLISYSLAFSILCAFIIIVLFVSLYKSIPRGELFWSRNLCLNEIGKVSLVNAIYKILNFI